MNMKIAVMYLLVLAAVSACSDDAWYGDEKKLNVEGKRISILSHEQKFAKEEMSTAKVVIGNAVAVKDWTQSGCTASHLIGNLKFSANPALVWNKNIGVGSDYRNRLIAEPVVAEGVVYAFDSMGSTSAYDLESGRKLWEKDFLNAPKTTSVVGAGMAVDRGILYMSTGLGSVLAVDVSSLEVKWEKFLSSPVRSAPTYANDMLYVMTTDGKLHAIAAADGSEKWHYSSIPEETAILGGAAPAVVGDTVIAVFPSGEVVAFNAVSGSLLWGEALAGSSRLGGLSILMDIVARPVVKDDVLYVVGYSDIFMAINVKTGKKIWQRSIGGATNPLLVDRYVFVITNDGDIVALEQKNGKIIWVRTLPKYVNEEDRKGRITWQGPLMLDGKILVVGSYGEMAFLRPENGNLISREKVAESIQIPPVYADERLILLNSDANLMVYK